MCGLIGIIETLQKFSYTNPITKFTAFEPYWIRLALFAHAKHSLCTLTLLYPGAGGNFIGTLIHFECLDMVICEQRFLSLYTRAAIEVEAFLPASLKHLELFDRHCQRGGLLAGCDEKVSWARDTIKHDVGAKSRRLGNLEFLNFHQAVDLDLELYQQFLHGGELYILCVDAGIDFALLECVCIPEIRFCRRSS